MNPKFSEQYGHYVPESSYELVNSWFEDPRLRFRLSRSRGTKLGDFRFDQRKPYSVVSVNSDLNPYAFLLTLTHEYAHFLVHSEYKGKVKAHGIEWKKSFGDLLRKLVELDAFPRELEMTILNHARKPKASSSSDPQLYLALKQYDSRTKSHLLDLELGEIFVFKKRRFRSLEKRRSRYLCLDLSNQRKYLIPGTAEIEHE